LAPTPSLDIAGKSLHAALMNSPIERACVSLLNELAILLAAIEANLGLLSLLVKDLLSGEDSELLSDEVSFADAVDEVLYRAGLGAIDCLSALQEQALLMSTDNQGRLIAASQRYHELTERWTALGEAVHHVWRLRRPPQ
jgi:hypothetical protein